MSVKVETELKCPKCGSCHIVHHGFKTTIKRGKQQRYMCEKGHTFYNEEETEVR